MSDASLTVGDVFRYGAVAGSMGAGILHLTAADAHREHGLVMAFFVVVGLSQLAWGGAIAAVRSRLLLDIGGLGNAAVIGIWLTSRMTGISFIPGAEHSEPIGIKDSVTTLLEVVVVAICITLLLKERSPIMRQWVSTRSVAPAAAATLILIVPGLMVPAHHHAAHGHSEIAANGHGDVAAAGHPHDEKSTRAKAGHGHGSSGSQAVGGHGHTDTSAAVTAHQHPAAKVKGTQVVADAPVKAAEGISAKVRYGPFLLPPKSLGGNAHYNRILTNIAKPCSDCFIVYMKPDLVYEDGSPANLDTGTMLHHAVWTRPSFPDATCNRDSAIGSQGERFFASGNERTPFVLPGGFGYHVGNDSWTLIAELMNHEQKAQNVYISLDVKYRPASDGPRKVAPIWMDVDNCKDSQYAIPAGKSHTTWTWKSSVTGRIVAAGGHVHDGGVKTVLRNESTAKSVCTSVAGYGTKPAFEGSIESMSFCSWDAIGTVRSGQTLGLHAYYDSTEAQNDVMGIMMAFVYETNDLSGGSPPPSGDAPKEPKPPPPHEH